MPFKFGAAIDQHRGDKDLRKAAAEVGTSASTLSRIIRGNTPDLDTFVLICNWLGCSPLEFLPDITPPPDKPVCAPPKPLTLAPPSNQ